VKLVIPWHFFFTALRQQPQTDRKDWITNFAFNDAGVALIHDTIISLEDVLRAAFAPQPEREKRELEVLAELIMRKRATLVC
jgi:hypothetical protein